VADSSPSSMRQLIVLGTGGNCLDIVDIINDINSSGPGPIYEFIGFLDDDLSASDRVPSGFPLLGPLSCASYFPEAHFVNGIGSQSNFWRKSSILSGTEIPLDRFQTLVHPSAHVSPSSAVGIGAVIFPNVSICYNARIGNHVIVLSNSVINHDCEIGDYTCITSGVCISGMVTVGKSCYLGTNSTIVNNVSIDEGCLVGAGSVVLGDISSNSVVVGSPACCCW
jgi:sugar O-acyltransferase (sialic acid O-acetyltransferase NeuD family)